MMMKIQNKYEAVVFDFDGVLGMTMEDNYRAWAKAFSSYGIVLGREEYFLMEGMNTTAVAETILRKHGMNCASADAIAAMKEANYLAENSFEFYPGALDLIEILNRSFRLGLVTGGSLPRLKKTAGDDFLQKFIVCVTGDMVKNPKPHPEPYLTAASRLHLPPQKCLAIENAPLGIQSAKKAGMDCVAICSTLDREYLRQADFVVDDIAALSAMFDCAYNE